MSYLPSVSFDLKSLVMSAARGRDGRKGKSITFAGIPRSGTSERVFTPEIGNQTSKGKSDLPTISARDVYDYLGFLF